MDDLEIPETLDQHGTVGVGINGVIAEFSDIQMSRVHLQIDEKPNTPSDEITDEDMEFEDQLSPEQTQTIENINQVADEGYEPCIVSDLFTRKKWLVNNVNPTEIEKVEFCPICCSMLARGMEVDVCMNECQLNLKSKYDKD